LDGPASDSSAAANKAFKFCLLAVGAVSSTSSDSTTSSTCSS